jgi:succinate-semialdehyde dehydrogenase/glutarate-semialdehyde dehydrogenase
MDRTTRIGPLARADSVRDLQSQVDRSVRAGAVVATGGRPLVRPGFYYPPRC